MRLRRRAPQKASLLLLAASHEATALSGYLGPEHLLLATARVNGTSELLDSVGIGADDVRAEIERQEAEALGALGISLDSVRSEIEEQFGEAAWRRPLPCLPIAPEAKRALARAEEEARREHSPAVTAEHVLLALLQTSPSACNLLRRLDVEPHDVVVRLPSFPSR